MDTRLFVLTTIFNPWRYKSRLALYERFRKYVEDSGGILYTAEVAYREREFCVTTKGNPQHLQLRSPQELWHKERATNLLIERLPQDWLYMAHVDADVQFARPDWVPETVQLLQHYPTIQMFSEALDLSPEYEVLAKHRGFYASYVNGAMQPTTRYDQFHPGFAHAYRRDFINNVGGLFDESILGSGDRFMAMSCIGKPSCTPDQLSDGYKERMQLWAQRAQKYIKNDVGYMPGALLHYWHGKKIFRRYKDRWKILVDNQFDPEFDLKRDWQGLWQFTDRQPQLRYDVRAYFQQRNEDDISTA